MVDALPPPNVIGLPDIYSRWRQHQDEAALRVVDSPARFIGLVCPTGFGKSLAYMAAHMLGSGRTIILTSTKALQDQLVADFGGVGLADVRGRNAYECLREKDGSRCDTGVCIAGVQCDLKSGGCLYYDAVRAAIKADAVVTNYAYWMTANRYGEGLGTFNLMVLDEAHDAPDHVSSFLTVALDRKDELVKRFLPNEYLIHKYGLEEWRYWAKQAGDSVKPDLESLKRSVAQGNAAARRAYTRAHSFQTKMTTLARMKEDWIWDLQQKGRVEFTPIWPTDYSEGALFLKIPKVVLTSATVRPKTAELLGIDESGREWLEYPHSFPVWARRLIHVPTVRMNYRIGRDGLRAWVARIDQIIRPRLDRKGIVHTVSYKRRDLVLANSRHAPHMITHRRRDSMLRVKEFKHLPPPRILVSPVMTTGWDFPYTDCEYQIIGKLSFPDTRSKLVKARTKLDPSYSSYVAMLQLVQACGRGVRAPDDQCETFIIDDNIKWFKHRYHKFAPDWFWPAYKPGVTIIPSPPTSIADRREEHG